MEIESTSLLIQLAIEGLAFGATVILGLFGVMKALHKNQTTSQETMQKTFLDHLEKKNGHFERVTAKIADTHRESNKEFTTELHNLSKALEEIRHQQHTTTTVLDNNTKVLSDALEVIHRK